MYICRQLFRLAFPFVSSKVPIDGLLYTLCGQLHDDQPPKRGAEIVRHSTSPVDTNA